MAPKDTVCLQHSGMISEIKNNGQKLDHVISLLESQSDAILSNDKRITRIYTIVGVLSFIGGGAVTGLGMGIRLGWL